MNYVVGIDTSTTATKAVLIDEDGAVVAVGASEYDFETPQPLWTEQHPGLWWDATVRAIGSALVQAAVPGDAVVAVGLTGQMHGLVLLDKARQVLRPAILWNDQRTGAECDEIRARLGKENLIRITGNDALTGFTAPKILWVRNNEPRVFADAAHILLPKDFVRFRLTDELATDKAGAAGTILFDLAARDWSPEVLRALDVDPALLPVTFEGPAVTGTITAEAAAATGLKEGTPVIGGGGDQAANAVGVGAVTEGVVALSLGTSGVVFVTTDQPRVEPQGRLHAFCHAVPGKWHFMGVMLSAAGSLRWFHDALTPNLDYNELVTGARAIDPGAEGLMFLPYLTGERTPHPDPLARGAFVGLTVRHTRDHLTRAVLEGVAFGLRDSFDLIRSSGTKIAQIRASGGGTRSPLWRQILADVLANDVVTVSTPEGAAYGAGLLGAVGAEWHADTESACAAWVSVGEAVEPSDHADRYTELHERYRQLYPALAPSFHATADE